MTISALVGARASKGFTLAELLIALAILGVIATFTIPKILSSSQNGQNTSIAKEAASMVSGAFQNYTLNNGLAATNSSGDFTQFMNYVSTDTATTYTSTGTTGTSLQACTATRVCLKLHNGGILQVDTAQKFGTTTTATNGVVINVDPDGTGSNGAISLIQYASGRLTTRGQAGADPTQSGTGGAAGTITTVATDPAYLSTWN